MQDFPTIRVYINRNINNKYRNVSLASCSSDDDDKDITKEIIMNVSAEPGVMYDLFDSMGEHPIECMQVMTEDEPGQWQYLYFSEVKGFTYERGHEYVLRVKRTILANPPQDASNRTYELVRILADKKVENVAGAHPRRQESGKRGRACGERSKE